MKKKIFLSIFFIILSIVFGFSYTFAANNPVDNIRNAVGGPENVVEDAAMGITNGAREGMNKIENAGQNASNDMKNKTNMSSNDSNYTSQRTSTRMASTEGNFFTNNSTLWTWVTMAILGVIIVALVWYYGKQFNYTDNYHDDNENY